MLLAPRDDASEDCNVTFQWRIDNRVDGVTYCFDVVTDKGQNPCDGSFENLFHAWEASERSVVLDPFYYNGARFEWAVRVTACTAPGALCKVGDPPRLTDDPPCSGTSFCSMRRQLQTHCGG